MILQRSTSQHEGKVISKIESDSGSDGLVMANYVRITFTDGSVIRLGQDWRGSNCYISEYVDDKDSSRSNKWNLLKPAVFVGTFDL